MPESPQRSETGTYSAVQARQEHRSPFLFDEERIFGEERMFGEERLFERMFGKVRTVHLHPPEGSLRLMEPPRCSQRTACNAPAAPDWRSPGRRVRPRRRLS